MTDAHSGGDGRAAGDAVSGAASQARVRTSGHRRHRRAACRSRCRRRGLVRATGRPRADAACPSPRRRCPRAPSPMAASRCARARSPCCALCRGRARRAAERGAEGEDEGRRTRRARRAAQHRASGSTLLYRWRADVAPGTYRYRVFLKDASGEAELSSKAAPLIVTQPPRSPSEAAVEKALAWAAARLGRVSVAVVDTNGRLYGLDEHSCYRSAVWSRRCCS